MVSITLDRERHFKFRNREVEELERMMGGKSCQSCLVEGSYTFVKRALFVGLRQDSSIDTKKWTLDHVEDLIEAKQLEDKEFTHIFMWEKVQEAFNDSGIYGNFMKAEETKKA